MSIASLWEIAIKQSLGKLKMSQSIEEIILTIEHSTTSILSVETSHVACVAGLPYHHKDPFDRLIIAQALTENLSYITSDSDFEAYGVTIL